MWAVFAIAAAFVWACMSILDKFLITDKIRDPIRLNVLVGLSHGVFYVLATLLFGAIDWTTRVIFVGIFAGFLFRMSVLLFLRALKDDEVSVVAPLVNTKAIFVALLSWVFLGEILSVPSYVGIGILSVGVLVLSLKKLDSHLFFRKGMYGILAFSVLLAVYIMLLKIGTFFTHPLSLFFWIGVGEALMSLVQWLCHKKEIEPLMLNKIPFAATSGFLAVVGTILFTYALQTGSVALVSAVALAEPLFVLVLALVLSMFFPKLLHESLSRNSIVQKIIGTLLIVVGLVLLL